MRLDSRQTAYAVLVRARTAVYRRPGGSPITALEPRRASFSSSNHRGVQTIAAALAELRGSDCRARWYRVQLPGRRPTTGAKSGYLRAAGSTTLVEVPTRIVVDLSERRLTLFDRGRAVLRTPVAVGAPSTPTPRGRFFVEERIRVTDPGGPYGAAALALSAFSEKLTYWPEGGPVAIHGTNEPGSIGRAVSHGCVRVGARALEQLFALTELGTPVFIVA
ncbi:MAG: L,D-transpeptidase [Gaiellaceae bacterium]